MIRGAICESEVEQRKYIKSLVWDYSNLHGIAIPIDTYPDIPSFLKADKRYDLFITGALTPATKGIPFAKEVRKKNKWIQILYMASCQENLIASAYLRAHNYLIQPVQEKEFHRILDEAIEFLSCNLRKKQIVFEKGSKFIFLMPEEIYHIKAAPKHRIRITTKNGAYEIGGMIRKEYIRLQKSGFENPHRSYIVNMAKIEKLEGNKLDLEGGAVIPLSSKKACKFKSAFKAFLEGK